MANVFNAKVNESWCMLARFNVEKLNNENQYCIPSAWGPSKKDLLLHQGSNLIGVFFHELTCTMSGHLQKPLL